MALAMLSALVVSVWGSGLRLVPGGERLIVREPGTTMPVQFRMNDTNDIDAGALLRRAEDDAIMSVEFLKSVVEDLVAGADLLTSMVPVIRGHRFPAEITGPQVLMYWVHSHSAMATLQSWVASVDPNSPNDVFDVGEAVYKLVKMAQYEAIHSAVWETPFCNFMEKRGDMVYFNADVTSSVPGGQSLFDLDPVLVDKLTLAALPPEGSRLLTLGRTDPTDVDQIERIIEAVRLMQREEALSSDLYLRFEALATYVTVFRSLLPLICTHPRYVEIGKCTIDTPRQENFVDYLSTLEKMHNAIYEVYEERDQRRGKALSRKTKRTLHSVRIGITKSAISNVFNVVQPDLTTPLFPRSEPRPRTSSSQKKRRKRRTKKKKKIFTPETGISVAPLVDDELETKPPMTDSTDAITELGSRTERQCSITDCSASDHSYANIRTEFTSNHAANLPERKSNPAEALKTKLTSLPSRMTDFMKVMSRFFEVKQSRTKNSMAFFDRQTGNAVFGMHRPHGGKQERIRDDILCRIRGKIRQHLEA